MRYFKEIAFWKIVLLNIIVGLCMSAPFLIGLLYCFGFFRPPTTGEQLLGILIFVFILSIILLSNFLLWKFGKKQYNENKKNENIHKKTVKIIVILVILFLTIGSFFVLPDIWLIFNGWWF